MSQDNTTKQLVLDRILDRPANQVLKEFGDGKASPGSGSAAALLSLLSARMILTVCKISSNKASCKKYHNEFEYISDEVSKNHEIRLRDLFENDAREFEKVVQLRKNRNNSTDPTEKANYSREALDLLEHTTENIFEMADLSFDLVKYGIAMYENGWEHIRGDSGVAISAALSGIMSAIFIINLNLKTLKRRKYSAEALGRSQELQKKFEELQIDAFACISSISTESLESIQLELENQV